MELYKKYRPTLLKQIIGQDKAVKMVHDLISKNKIPHAMLFTGPSGCGKTTLARILKDKLKCGDHDFSEINVADFRGIDMVRDIRSRMMLHPIQGPCRVWLIDECFPKGTLVCTPTGGTSIETLNPGDWIENAQGPSIIKNVFRNTVPLSRIAKLHFNDGTHLITTLQHEFLTPSGWVEAKHLDGHCILSDSRYLMNERTKDAINLRILQSTIPTEVREQTKMLFQSMRRETQTNKSRARKIRAAKMPRVQPLFHSQEVLTQKVLHSILSSQEQVKTPAVQSKIAQQGSGSENQPETKILLQDGEGPHTRTSLQPENERDNESSGQGNRCKKQSDKRSERHISSLDWNERREWSYNSRAANVIQPPWRSLENGTSHFDNGFQGRWIPDLLQSGYRTQEKETRSGSRWGNARVEKDFLARCKESETARTIRVDCVEVFKYGCNEESFRSAVSDKEMSQGFAEFFDLEIEGHSSYFANGLLVHNCHQLSKDAQNAILKMLEDTPDHVYFFLATTEPNKLLRTIITRCTEVKTASLTERDIEELVKSIAAKESAQIDGEVVARIVEAADGSARKALVLLHAILEIEDKDDQLNAILSSDSKRQAIDIARALFNNTSWSNITKILKEVEDEPETIRWLILGYATSVLLGGGNLAKRAYLIIRIFQDNFYDSKKAGLVACCWEAVNTK